MIIGDIVIVEQRPCPANDVLDVIGRDKPYPVYGVVKDYDPDDEMAAVLCLVIDCDGDYICDGWWFKEEEVQVIEAAPEVIRRRRIPDIPGWLVHPGDEVAF